ncbi:sulfotransferase [Gracilimonas sediminicola]|uniref:Sulfotransferase family protein n=1 Tax=Gracilimonas sediminicola TaxID=2952158 RepID=A0A9X2L0N6_9BACT|nr:hypothetical protein [Gracilimonas sediminicola]
MIVVNLGLPKTGTTSLSKALDILGVTNFVGDFVHRTDKYPEGTHYLLTVRKDVHTWYKSVRRYNRQQDGFKNSGLIKQMRIKLYGSRQPRPNWKDRYLAHNNALRKMPDVLELCFEKGDGWNELCEFLGVEVPDQEFPHLNKSK